MSNVKSMKRVFAIVIAATCMLTFSFSMAFAAESPTGGKVVTNGNVYTTTGTTTAELTKAKNKKTVLVAQTVVKDKKYYTITKIGPKAFGKKTKVVKIKSKKCTSVAKSAFANCKKAKVIVKVNKKMTAKNFKKLKKALIKAGIKSKNIKRVAM